MKKSFFRLCAAFVVALLSACGGGGDAFTETSQPVAIDPSWNNAPVAGSSAPAEARAFASAVPKKLASVSSDPFGGVGADEAGRQMFVFARANYGVYFPSDQPKLRYQCFDYSYYPETDRYLGLVVLDGCAGYSLGEVYIMGSVWGTSPSFVARLIDIVPIVQPLYVDKIVALWTFGYPYMVTKTSVTPAVNNTSYQSGAIKLSSCGVANNNPQSDGMLLLECTAASDMQRHAVKLDPVTGTLSDFAGTVPSGTTFTLAESSSTQPVSGSTSARVADGWFYKDPNVDWRLLFQPDGGTTVVVKEGTFAQDGSIRVIRAYSH